MSDEKWDQLKAYAKPELTVIQNLKDITFECPDWECSIGGIDELPVPPAG